MAAQLIIAFDFHTKESAQALLRQLDPSACAIKIGHELFILLGPDFVRYVVKQGFKVFLDLKLFDIPNTVGRACRVCAELGVWMLNVHAMGGLSMLQAAHQALHTYAKDTLPLLIAVTILTSTHESDLIDIGWGTDLENQVQKLSELALQAGCDGVVCAAFEVPQIKKFCGQHFLTVTPGIRLAEAKDDQVRVVTPKQALDFGSDYLVIGRPITQAQDPAQEIQKIINLIS